MPKYGLIYGEEYDPSAARPEEMQQSWPTTWNSGQNNDALAGGEALHPASTATTIQVKGGKGGKPVFTDGPIAETEEVLDGFTSSTCLTSTPRSSWPSKSWGPGPARSVSGRSWSSTKRETLSAD